MRFICKIIFRLSGWHVGPVIPPGMRQCVIVAAPHTSNWDLVYALGAFEILGLNIRFTIKKEWMRFPFRAMMRSVGAIPVDRSPRKPGEERLSMVEAMADLFKENEDLILMVTPEGTRGKVTKWKTGFYQVALQAGVPILLGYVDYKKKEGGTGKTIYPKAENFEKDMREIMNFYKQITPCIPENFGLDADFS